MEYNWTPSFGSPPPLNVRAPSVFRVDADLLNDSELVDVLAIAAVAAGRFQGPRDGYERGAGGSIFPRRLSGGHKVILMISPGRPLPAVELVANMAAHYAWNRVDADALRRFILDQFGLPGVIVERKPG